MNSLEQVTVRAKQIAAANCSHEALEEISLTRRDRAYVFAYYSSFGDDEARLEDIMALRKPVEVWHHFGVTLRGSPVDDAAILGYRLRKLGLLDNDEGFFRFKLTEKGVSCAQADAASWDSDNSVKVV